MSVISMKQLLEAGVHFGHQTRRWNPKMAPYIFTERNGIHIIDLQKSVVKVDEAYKAVSEIATQGGTILFVGTKKQAQDAVKVEAERCGMYYVNERWLGGMLTNFRTIERNTQLLSEGVITALVAQRPERQGYEGIKSLCNHLLFKQHSEMVNLMPIDILLKENLKYYLNNKL